MKGGFSSSFVDKINKQLKTAFQSIKEELDDHLHSINQNTDEIQSNYEVVAKLESKMDKLESRIDEIQMVLREAGIGHQKPVLVDKKHKIQPLLDSEKRVFLVMYAAGESFMSYTEIAKKLGSTPSIIRQYVLNLMEKGIPVLKDHSHNKPHVRISKEFIELQAKENIVDIDANLVERTV